MIQTNQKINRLKQLFLYYILGYRYHYFTTNGTFSVFYKNDSEKRANIKVILKMLKRHRTKFYYKLDLKKGKRVFILLEKQLIKYNIN